MQQLARKWIRRFVRDPRVSFWLAVVILIAASEALVRTGVLSPASYAAPTEIGPGVITLFMDGGFASDVWATTRRTLLSVGLGFPAGVLVAIGLYSLGRARASGEFVLDFVRSVPITAVIPLFIAVYGVGEKNKIAIGAVAALLVTAITVWVGIRQALDRFRTMVYLYRPNYFKRLFLIVLPEALPAILAALKLAVSSALILVIVAEMFIGTDSGIGKVINDKTYSDDRPGQYAAVFCAGALGYALNRLFEWIHRRFLLATGMTPIRAVATTVRGTT